MVFVWSLNNIMILVASLSLQRDAKHEACENARLEALAGTCSTCRHRNTGKGDGEKNGTSESEPALELLSFEFPAFADERSDPIG